jgi:hypothetical protein
VRGVAPAERHVREVREEPRAPATSRDVATLVRVAIVGSRDFPWLGDVTRYVNLLDEFTVVLSGGARGVDRVAAQAARARGMEVQEYLADWEQYGKRAGMLRNAELVYSADFVMAFWDGESPGTKNALDHARHMMKPFGVSFG